MEFQTPYKRKHSTAQNWKGKKSRVDLTGYRSKEIRILEMINAGRLKSSGVYDVPAGDETDIEDLECDPTRDPGFDMASASMIQNSLRDKAKRAMKRAVNASGDVSEPQKEVSEEKEEMTKK